MVSRPSVHKRNNTNVKDKSNWRCGWRGKIKPRYHRARASTARERRSGEVSRRGRARVGLDIRALESEYVLHTHVAFVCAGQ
jgi:hypothetical protein